MLLVKTSYALFREGQSRLEAKKKKQVVLKQGLFCKTFQYDLKPVFQIITVGNIATAVEASTLPVLIGYTESAMVQIDPTVNMFSADARRQVTADMNYTELYKQQTHSADGHTHMDALL